MEGIVREAGKMSAVEFDQLAREIFRGPKTAAELVGEGRKRP